MSADKLNQAQYWHWHAGAKSCTSFKLILLSVDHRLPIRKSDLKNKKLADLYCACSEVECGHTFVFNATFPHSLSPSGRTGNNLLKFLIEQLNPDERQFVLNLLNNNRV